MKINLFPWKISITHAKEGSIVGSAEFYFQRLQVKICLVLYRYEILQLEYFESKLKKNRVQKFWVVCEILKILSFSENEMTGFESSWVILRSGRYLEPPSSSVNKSRSLLIVISVGMSFGTALNGFVNGVFCVFHPWKSQILILDQIDFDKVEVVFHTFKFPLSVLFKKVKMHNSIACKSQFCVHST